MPTQPSREGLAQLYGQGRVTFYARFQRYGVKPIPGESRQEVVSDQWRTLLIRVMDENLNLVADHVWCDLPKKTDDCWWALPPNQLLRLEASVGTYKKRTGETCYNFAPIWRYERLKYFPLETPDMIEGYHRFFDRIVTDPKLLKIWVGSAALTPHLPLQDLKFEIS